MIATKFSPSGACPRFFRALCRTASSKTSGGYQWAGYGLIGHVSRLSPRDMEESEWEARVEALDGLIVARDDAAVLAWLDAHLPACMELVPRPRREAFLRGVYKYVLEEENEIVFD